VQNSTTANALVSFSAVFFRCRLSRGGSLAYTALLYLIIVKYLLVLFRIQRLISINTIICQL